MNGIKNYLYAMKRQLILVAILGLAASLIQTILIIFMSRLEVGAADNTMQAAIIFLSLILIFFMTNFPFNFLMTKISYSSAYQIQLILSKKIIKFPLASLEKFGSHRLQAILTQDTFNIANFISITPNLLINSLLILSCLIYLFFLSTFICLTTFALLSIIVICFFALDQVLINPRFTVAREQMDGIYKIFQGLIEGNKELKLNQVYQETFNSALNESAYHYYKNNFIAMTAFSFWQLTWQTLLFVLIGFVLFHTNTHLSIIQQAITLILFMTSPLIGLLNFFPIVRRSINSFATIKNLDHHLNDYGPLADLTSFNVPMSAVRPLHLENLCYHYESEKNDFTLGPLNITLQASQATFIVGENGSGKSTLVKLLSGLYQPTAGQIVLNNLPMCSDKLSWYQSQVSVLFYHYHLFDNFVLPTTQDLETFIQLSKDLKIDAYVDFSQQSFAKNTVSDGQRRRLALLNVLMQDKPICILDEPTADQDLKFKEYFYKELIPKIKKDRFLIVISHDPHYFHLADQIIHLQHGQLSVPKVVNNTSFSNALDIKI